MQVINTAGGGGVHLLVPGFLLVLLFLVQMPDVFLFFNFGGLRSKDEKVMFVLYLFVYTPACPS